MRHRALVIVALIGLGTAALVLIPNTARPTIANSDKEKAKVTLASISTPNPTLLRRLDAEVSPPPVQAPPSEPVKVAETSPVTVTPPAAAATSSSQPAPDPNLKPDTVGPSAVNLRSGPSGTAQPISVLQPGEAVQVGEHSGGWVKVTRADGSTGWMYASYLASSAAAAGGDPQPKRITSANQPRAVVQGSNGDLQDRTARIASPLPAYSRPNDGAQSVFTLQPGDEVYIAEVRGSWIRVETQDGMSAWIRR